MSKIEIFSDKVWKPFSAFGLEGKFWNLNSETVINSGATLVVLFICLIAAGLVIKRKNSMAAFLILSFVRSFKDLVSQSIKRFHYSRFFFITALFVYIFFCNIISIIPWFEEPTTDLNTTLALGIISFLYVQTVALKSKGLKGYCKEFLEPFFLLLPLNIVSELAKIISISFRLYGNIFGGSVISKIFASFTHGAILTESLALFSGINLLIVGFFVIFEGAIQAFVFSTLTLTYLALATQIDEGPA